MDEKKYEAFVHWNDGNYISVGQIKEGLFAIYPFLTVIISTVGIVAKLPFFVAAILIVDVLYIAFYRKIASGKTVKSYPLRFLVNGIETAFLSASILLFVFAFLFASGESILPAGLIFLIPYLISVSLYLFPIVKAVERGDFLAERTVSGEEPTPKSEKVFAIAAVGGFAGMIVTCRLVSLAVGLSSPAILYIVAFLADGVLIFTSVGFIHFVKYYYCRKYAILCDASGDSASPGLIPGPREKKERGPFAKIMLTTLELAAILFVGFILTGIALQLCRQYALSETATDLFLFTVLGATLIETVIFAAIKRKRARNLLAKILLTAVCVAASAFALFLLIGMLVTIGKL